MGREKRARKLAWRGVPQRGKEETPAKEEQRTKSPRQEAPAKEEQRTKVQDKKESYMRAARLVGAIAARRGACAVISATPVLCCKAGECGSGSAALRVQ